MSLRSALLACVVVVVCVATARAESREAVARHVILISVDGLRGDLLQDLVEREPEKFPGFVRFVREGVTTFNARTDCTFTLTIPNHVSMVTGRPVTQPKNQSRTVQHGYTRNNTAPRDWTLHRNGNSHVDYVASVFDVVHDHGLSTALYATKTKFSIFEETYDAEDGAVDVVEPDHGRDKIDRFYCSPPMLAPMHETFLEEMAQLRYNYALVHYRDPDSAGHDHGWGGTKWVRSVARIDGYLTQIFELVENDDVLRDRVSVILTADHGGHKKHHRSAKDWKSTTIPFFVWGAGVAPGGDLYSLNADTRRDPETGNPDCDAQPQPIRNGDAANLALRLLGLDPVPGSSINVRQDLRVSSD